MNCRKNFFMDNKSAVFFILMIVVGIDSCLRKASEPLERKDPVKPRPEKPSKPAGGNRFWQCGTCGSPVDVTLRLKNNITETPPLDHSITLMDVNQRELLYLMLQAANQDKKFRFSMTHWGSELGMMVDAINGVKSESRDGRWTYWQILFANGTALKVGVSTYVPKDNDEIIFQYTTYTPISAAGDDEH